MRQNSQIEFLGSTAQPNDFLILDPSGYLKKQNKKKYKEMQTQSQLGFLTSRLPEEDRTRN
jgi:hypothetical protein